ncbi:conserved hypothetical protein [Vibrio nigripulchritudo AM115]|nr:conserved hypothetical protein [Vibrio nigripulchritudo AM115]
MIHNARLSRRQRTKQAAALRLKHKIHRKLKMLRIVCRFEACYVLILYILQKRVTITFTISRLLY